MNFLQTIRKSIYDRAFYVVAQTEPSGRALKRYTLFIFFVSFLSSVTIYAPFYGWASQSQGLENIRTEVLALYPDELILTLHNGKMTSNVEEPYHIPMPGKLDTKSPKNLLTINTKGSITSTDFDRYSTSAILGNDALWIYNPEENKIEIQKFDRFTKESLLINKQKATEWTDIAFSIGKKVMIGFLIFLPLILFMIFWIKYLFYLLFGAGIIWIIASIRKMKLSYGQSYKLGLSLMTLPILYNTLAVGPFLILKIPFGFTIILAVVAYLNFAPENPSKDTETPQPGGGELAPEVPTQTEPTNSNPSS